LPRAGKTAGGFWQFPYLSRLPDGRLFLTHHVAPDSEQSYGLEAPTYVSADEGRIWQAFKSDIREFFQHPTFIAHLPDGECFFIPPQRPYPVSVLRGATPVGQVYGSVKLYAAEKIFGEPFIAYVPSGELLCTLRTTQEAIMPLYLARSSDDGHTWTSPEQIAECGVFPNILTLENGVTAVSFGRRGMWMMFSADGRGRTWEQHTMLVAPAAELYRETCGYSSMEALDDHRSLIAYSDFRYPVGGGETRKAILVREVTVEG
jgi:hypothetical protein